MRRAPSATHELRPDPVGVEPRACVPGSGPMPIGGDGTQSMVRPLGSVARIYRSRRAARVRRAPSATHELRTDPVGVEPRACVPGSGPMPIGGDGAQSMVRPLGSDALLRIVGTTTGVE